MLASLFMSLHVPLQHEVSKVLRKKVPENKLYTSMDDEMPVPSVIALPGGDNLDLGRLWHFFSIIFWVLNGVVYVVLRQNLSPRGTSGRGVPSIT